MKKEGDPRKTKAELFLEPKDHIIFAMNTPDLFRAKCLASMLSGRVGYIKFGPEMNSAILASLLCPSENVAFENLMKIRSIFNAAEGRILWDSRLVGIANSIGPTVKMLSDIGVSMLSVQAAQGLKSINAAIENKGRSLLFAATPRSSIDHEERRKIDNTVLNRQVARLKDLGIDGVICSSHETAGVRAHLPGALIATRDVRPAWVEVKNRSKFITPGEAIAAGADFVIIGKPISSPPSAIGDPTRAADQIISEIIEALAAREAVSIQQS